MIPIIGRPGKSKSVQTVQRSVVAGGGDGARDGI